MTEVRAALEPAVEPGREPLNSTEARVLLIVEELLARARRAGNHDGEFHDGRYAAYVDAVALLTGIPHATVRADLARRAERR